MKSFEELSESEQIRVVKLAQIYFDHYPQKVISLMKSCEANIPPMGSTMYRPELWKDHNWGWFAEYSTINPEQFNLPINSIPYYPLLEKNERRSLNVVALVTIIMGFVLMVYYFMYYSETI